MTPRNFGILAATILFSSLWMPTLSLGQTPEFNPSMSKSDQMRKEGQLLTVQISRGNPIRIFVVGKEEAKIDLSQMSLIVRRIKPYPARILKVDKNNDSYVVSDPKEFKKSEEIEVVTKLKGKAETFRFELNKDLP